MIKKMSMLAKPDGWMLGIMLLLLLATPAFAWQSTPVSGTVKSSDGTPLAGASVVVKGSSQTGTTTDDEGQFTLTVAGDAVLQISMTGFKTLEVPVQNRSTLDITLEPGTTDLDDVVVVGYSTSKKVNLTGAVTAISGKEMARRQVGQTSMALQGVAPGVTVTQASGQPGVDGGTIRIRGIGTLNNSDPLVLVDGVVMSINNIDPSTIESISVLKDAASASIYGSRAANGVILVTTKRGSRGKFTVSYDAYVGKQRTTDMPKMVNGLDHMRLINEAHVNVGRSPLFSEQYINDYIANKNTNPDLYPDTDWRKEVLNGSGLQTNHAVSVSGGTDKIQFFGTAGMLDQEGLIKNVNFKRFFVRLNTNVQISSKLRGTFDIYVRDQTRNAAPQFPGATGAALNATGTDLIWGLVNKLPATWAAVYSNGLYGEGQNGVNPVAIMRDGGWWKNKSMPLAGNFALEYKPFRSVTARVAYAPTYTPSRTRSFVNTVKTYDPNGVLRFTLPAVNTFDDFMSEERIDQVDANITFNKTYGKHTVTALGGYQFTNSDYSEFGAFRDDFLFPDYAVLNAGSSANMRNNGWATDWSLISYFGRINYSYDDRYLFEANLRYDGSSRFAKGNKWGAFPSFSAGWRISQEAFMEDVSWIDELKLRASWGKLGNQQIGSNYPFAPTVSLSPRYISNDQIQNGAAILSLANTDISWETTAMTNIGIDARLMRRLSVSFDYYQRKTTGILLQLSIPRTMGVDAPYQNAGVVENKGWDLQIDYNNRDNAFTYGATFTLSDVKNKVVDLRGIQQTGTIVNREGYPMNSLFLLRSQGLISASDFDGSGNYLHTPQSFGVVKPGDIRYEDVDKNGIINNDDRVVMGSTIPRFTYSLRLYAEYKGIDFSAFIQGVGKVDGYLTGSAITPFLSGGTAYEYQKNRWTEENPNPNAVFPRYAFGEVNNTQNSSFWMKSAAYLRMKNMQIGYTIPKAWSNSAKIQSLRVYVSGENLFTIDDFWPGWDPEIPAGNAGAYYPQVKLFNLGLNLKF
ncbi:MAG TPA: TonB-dependent receptor [Flavihumibacter sp.]|jgi:TonB-linked SusC/RagA family outer membrane protein